MAKLNDYTAGRIRNMLDDVAVNGAACISAEKLVRMYGQNRLTKGIWRDLAERWEHLAEEWGYDVPPELLIGHDPNSNMICFAYGREFDQVKKAYVEPFLIPIMQRLGTEKAEAETEED
jgi:hypothetical protein